MAIITAGLGRRRTHQQAAHRPDPVARALHHPRLDRRHDGARECVHVTALQGVSGDGDPPGEPAPPPTRAAPTRPTPTEALAQNYATLLESAGFLKEVRRRIPRRQAERRSLAVEVERERGGAERAGPASGHRLLPRGGRADRAGRGHRLPGQPAQQRGDADQQLQAQLQQQITTPQRLRSPAPGPGTEPGGGGADHLAERRRRPRLISQYATLGVDRDRRRARARRCRRPRSRPRRRSARRSRSTSWPVCCSASCLAWPWPGAGRRCGRRLHSAEDVTALVDLPLLASIPLKIAAPGGRPGPTGGLRRAVRQPDVRAAERRHAGGDVRRLQPGGGQDLDRRRPRPRRRPRRSSGADRRRRHARGHAVGSRSGSATIPAWSTYFRARPARRRAGAGRSRGLWLLPDASRARQRCRSAGRQPHVLAAVGPARALRSRADRLAADLAAWRTA